MDDACVPSITIACVRHVAFEGIGTIADWAAARGHVVREHNLHRGDALPGADDADLLVVMGGPMCTRDEDEYPWLTDERRLIARAIAAGKSVLGICLGAQLIAEALGARVTRNPVREIGWWPVGLTQHGRASRSLGMWPDPFTPFHWHADTFDIPDGCTLLASSEACTNQAFEAAGGRVIALQFHPEMSRMHIEDLADRCAADLASPSPRIQSRDEIIDCDDRATDMQRLLWTFLDTLTRPDGRIPLATITHSPDDVSARPDGTIQADEVGPA